MGFATTEFSENSVYMYNVSLNRIKEGVFSGFRRAKRKFD